jgi:hypothetical protein
MGLSRFPLGTQCFLGFQSVSFHSQSHSCDFLSTLDDIPLLHPLLNPSYFVDVHDGYCRSPLAHDDITAFVVAIIAARFFVDSL